MNQALHSAGALGRPAVTVQCIESHLHSMLQQALYGAQLCAGDAKADAPPPKRVKVEGGWAAAAEATDDSHAQIKPDPDVDAAGELQLCRLNGATHSSRGKQCNTMLSHMQHRATSGLPCAVLCTACSPAQC